jgi:hypothetical protein
MKWPIDVMNIGQVNNEDVPLNTKMNIRLSRVYGLVAQQKVSLTLLGFNDLTKNAMDKLFENSIHAYVQYPEELK